MNDTELLALIEFVRNSAADACQAVAVKNFADREQWTNEGDVDPLEIEAARGADAGATTCRNDVQALDCFILLTEFKARR